MSQENVEVVRRMYSLLADRGAWRPTVHYTVQPA
jgi:hypothetical protein